MAVFVVDNTTHSRRNYTTPITQPNCTAPLPEAAELRLLPGSATAQPAAILHRPRRILLAGQDIQNGFDVLKVTDPCRRVERQVDSLTPQPQPPYNG